jgi:hypothetical protein
MILNFGLFSVLLLILTSTASATINTIKGTLSCFQGCPASTTQNIVPGKTTSFEVVGQFVDLSTGVTIDGNGVLVSYGARTSGAGSSIVVNFNVASTAAAGDHTVQMHYLVETNGPDTFKVHVVNKGTITSITPLTNIPLNQVVHLVVTGTKLDKARVATSVNYQNARILAGATNGQCTVELEFTQNGQGPLRLFDSTLTDSQLSLANTDFVYTGSPTMQFGSQLVSNPGIIPTIPVGGGSIAPLAFTDVAPRANMLNIFRRQNATPTFSENGQQFFTVQGENCNGMTGNQSRVITIPDLIWGVSNVGTAAVNLAFASQLKTGTQVLQTQTVPGLNVGETRNFTFTRQNSRVRVSTFLLHIGCFVSPTADFFFEDPPFTVIVNTNGAVVEAATNQTNNTRTY